MQFERNAFPLPGLAGGRGELGRLEVLQAVGVSLEKLVLASIKDSGAVSKKKEINIWTELAASKCFNIGFLAL